MRWTRVGNGLEVCKFLKFEDDFMELAHSIRNVTFPKLKILLIYKNSLNEKKNN